MISKLKRWKLKSSLKLQKNNQKQFLIDAVHALPSSKSQYFDFLLSYHQQYFDVSTTEIGKRLITSLIPFNRRFYDTFHEHPDLYGPYWIYTTLIVILAVSGNFNRFLNMGADEFTYDFNFVPVAATVVSHYSDSLQIYSVGIGLPIGLSFLMKFFGSNVKMIDVIYFPYIQIIGIYGYSFTSFLITATLCMIPSNTLQWVLICYSAITSTGFLMRTFWNGFEGYMNKGRYIVIGSICVVQVTLLLIFKLYFFKHV